MAKKAKEQINEIKSDVKNEAGDLSSGHQLSAERKKRLLDEYKKAVVALKELEFRNKKREKFKHTFKNFKEIPSINQKVVYSDVLNEQAEQDKNSISKEMAFAQLDGKVWVMFEEMEELIRPERKKELFDKLRYDTALKRDLVGITEVIKHIKQRDFDKALAAMVYFGVEDRMHEMETFFNVKLGSAFEQKVESFYNYAKSSGLNEYQIKDVASKNMNFATGTLNKMKSSAISALTGSDVSALETAVADYAEISPVSLSSSSSQSIGNLVKSLGSNNYLPREARNLSIKSLTGKLNFAKGALAAMPAKAISGAVEAFNLLNSEDGELSKKLKNELDGTLQKLKEDYKNNPNGKQKSIRAAQLKLAKAFVETKIQVSDKILINVTNNIKKFGGNDTLSQSVDKSRAKRQAEKAAEIACDIKVAEYDEKVKQLEAKLNEVDDLILETAILETEISQTRKERLLFIRAKDANNNQKILSGEVVSHKKIDYKSLDVSTIEADNKVDFFRNAKDDKRACKYLIEKINHELKKLKLNPEKNKDKIKECEESLKFYEDKIQEVDEFLSRFGKYCREKEINEKEYNINNSFEKIEAENDLDLVEVDFKNLMDQIKDFLNKNPKVEVLDGYIGRLNGIINNAAEQEKILAKDDKKRLIKRAIISKANDCIKELEDKKIMLQTGKSKKQQTFDKKPKSPEEQKRDHKRTLQDSYFVDKFKDENGEVYEKLVSKEKATGTINRIANAVNEILKQRTTLTQDDLSLCEEYVGKCADYLSEFESDTEVKFKGVEKLRETVKNLQKKIEEAKTNLEQNKSSENENNQGDLKNNNSGEVQVNSFTIAGEVDADKINQEIKNSPLPEPDGKTANLKKELSEEELAAQLNQNKPE